MIRRLGAWTLVAACSYGPRVQPTVVLHPSVPCSGTADRVDHAMCVAQTYVSRARARKDVIILNCANDKLVQLGVMKRKKQGADEITSAQIDKKAEELRLETEQCGGGGDEEFDVSQTSP